MNKRMVVRALLLAATSLPAAAEEIKVKIDGQKAADAGDLLERLNENGKSDGLTFVAAEADFRYRIAVYAESMKGSDFFTGGGADSSAAVLTPDCKLLFIVSRGGRATKGGAMNALSKEIVKRLKPKS